MAAPHLVVLLGGAILALVPCAAAAQTYAERIVGGLHNPMFGGFAPGDPSRLFVGRVWLGRIEILDLTTRTMLPEPFLEVTLPSTFRVEQGLLGLTFDPNYASNGYFYVDYTGPGDIIHVVRYQVLGDPATSNVADPTSAHPILSLPKPGIYWHNAGWIDFGPNDGYLYVNIGDPGSGQAQDVTDNWHGKILRLDVHGDDFPDDPQRNYAIPPTNPFVGKEGDDEIWAYGLRNPWRASFDRLTGDLWINDTGEATREEVNYQPASSPGGENYGWPRREGTTIGPPGHGGPLLPEYTEPVYDYDHFDPDPNFQGSVIAGAAFYRGPVDAFYGHYFFSDNGSRHIWKLDPDAVDPRASVTNVISQLLPDAGNLNRVASFGEDAVGNLYLMDYDGPNLGEVFLVNTASKRIVWNGDDPTAGAPGDGLSWSNAANWTRDGMVDAGFVAEDSVVFAAGSSQPLVELGAERTVAALRFEAPYWLQGPALKVLSGNIFVDNSVTARISSPLSAESANHSIRKLGPGTLMVDGAAGQTVVKEGTLGGSGTFDHLTVRDGGVVAPGDAIGVMQIVESFTMHTGATLAIELNGADNSDPLAPQYDQVVAGGVFAAGGLLDIRILDDATPFAPSDGDTFTVVVAAGGIVGGFTEVLLPALAAGLAWEVDSGDGTFLAFRATSQLRSDYNGDGAVDAADFVIWRSLEGSVGSGLLADGTGPDGTPDGTVDELDYRFWLANFGRSVSNAAGQDAHGAPAPGSVLLLILGGAVTSAGRGFRGKRRRST